MILKHLFVCCTAICALVELGGGEALRWHSGNQFGNWKALRNVKCAVTPKTLLLTNIEKDSQLISPRLEIDPTNYNTFTIRYRASNLGPQGGQLYFAHANGRFSSRHSWRIPPLKADGQWHTLVLTAKELVHADNWFYGGTVTRFRLDPTDSPGGQIEIAELKLTHHKNVFFSGKPVVWNAQNQFAGWNKGVNLKFTTTEQVMTITDIGRDSQILSCKLTLNPQKYNRFSFRYRAFDTGRGSGQLFFAHADGRFSGSKYWRIPPLLADGQWHEIILKEKDISDSFSWFKKGIITRFRFDPTDSPGGKIEIKELKLYGEAPFVAPLPSLPLLTYTLDAPVWPRLTPELPQQLQTGEPYFQGLMIYSPHDQYSTASYLLNKFSEFYLRKSIFLKKKPQQAWLQFTADDGATAYLNGQEVGSSKDWRCVTVENVTSTLRCGRNLWAFCYRNNYSAGGVVGELFVQYADGTFDRFSTDQQFKSSVQKKPNWQSPNFDDRHWERVLAKPAPPHPPWGKKLAYINFTYPQRFLKAQAATNPVAVGRSTRLQYFFEGPRPQAPVHIQLEFRNGTNLFFQKTLYLNDREIVTTDRNHWHFAFDYRIPEFIADGDYKLHLKSNAIFVQRGGFPQLALTINGQKPLKKFTAPLTAQVIRFGETPVFAVNGRPIYPVWGSVNRHARPDRLPRHSSAPLNIVTVFFNLEQWWPRMGEFNFRAFDQAAQDYARHNPEAWFIWDLSLYLPDDWRNAHETELCRDDAGKISRDGSHLNYSFASQIALRDLKKALIKAINYLEKSPYASRIIGYRINGGHSIEWLGWDPRPGRTLDFSPAAQKAYQHFVRQHYPQLKDTSIPTLAERQSPASGEIIPDQSRYWKVIAYHDFISQKIADMLIELCQTARQEVRNRKLIGTYYGYSVTLNQTGRAQLRGHFALQKVLDSGAVDFLISPHAYSVRNLGDTMGDMKPFASLRNHNVVSVVEDDSRTHNGPYISNSPNYQTITKATTLGVLRRNAGIALCRNSPLYFYALCAGTEFDFPEQVQDMTTERIVGEHCLQQKVQRNAEIAVVFSEESVKALPMLHKSARNGYLEQAYRPDGTVKTVKQGSVVQAGESFWKNLTRYARLGAPVDYLLAEDLKNQTPSYKLYIFVNCFKYDRNFLAAVKKLQQTPCTMLWVYAPGYHFEQHSGLEYMRQLTGLAFGKAATPLMPAVKLASGQWLGTIATRVYPMFYALEAPGVKSLALYENGRSGLAATTCGTATSIFCGPWQFTVPFLTKLAQRSGVHIYSLSSDPIEANSHLFTLHTRFPGLKKIKFRQRGDILDVFNRKIIARDTDQFSFYAPLHSSWLFYCAPDAGELLKKLSDAAR